MATDTRKVAAGALLLLVSTALILVTGTSGLAVPLVVATVATLGLAAGSLLLGTSENKRPV